MHLTPGALQRDITGLGNSVGYDVQVRVVSAGDQTARVTTSACPNGIELGDCQTLLAVRDTLVGDGAAINWAAGLPT